MGTDDYFFLKMIQYGGKGSDRVENKAYLTPIVLLGASNGKSIGANGDPVSGANGYHRLAPIGQWSH